MLRRHVDSGHLRYEIRSQLPSTHPYDNVHWSIAVGNAHLLIDRAGPLVGVVVGPQSNIHWVFL